MEFEFEKPLQPIRDEIAQLEAKRLKGDGAASAKIASLQRRLAAETERLYAALSPWDTVQVARHPGRPTIMQYATKMCDEFVELHGDRVFGDDPAMVGGLARIGERPVRRPHDHDDLAARLLLLGVVARQLRRLGIETLTQF